MIRQHTFLRHLVVECGLLIDCLEAKQVSAYSDDFIVLLSKTLTALGSKVLVVSVAVDRVTRKESQYASLQLLCATGGHAVTSFLWDCETKLEPTVALGLGAFASQQPEVTRWRLNLAEQHRAPPVPAALPAIQPGI